MATASARPSSAAASSAARGYPGANLALEVLVQEVDEFVGLEEALGPTIVLGEGLLLLELIGGLAGLDAGGNDTAGLLEHGHELAQLLGAGDLAMARDDLGVGGNLAEQLLDVRDHALHAAAAIDIDERVDAVEEVVSHV